MHAGARVREVRRRWRAAIKRTFAAATTDKSIVETVLACWTHRTDDTIHTSAADQESGWRPPTLVQRDDGGGWEFDASGVLPAFGPERRSGAATNIGEIDGDTDDDADAQTIVTANGVYAYDCGWNNIEKSERATHAAARLLHRARQRADTSLWWSMRWPSGAASLLGRACDLNTSTTYARLRQLRENSVSHLRKLWRLATDDASAGATLVLGSRPRWNGIERSAYWDQQAATPNES